jgi:hypothetical protein
MQRRAKNRIKWFLVKAFHLGQKLGVDILPRHFYSEIPDIGKLKRTLDWKRPYSMVGVAGADLDEQLEFVRAVVSPSLIEHPLRGEVYTNACARNGEEGYGPIEADFLYTFVRTQRPSRIIQVGCGVSTAVLLMAGQDAGYRQEITCVDPYPTPFLDAVAKAGEINLIRKPVEILEYSFVDTLGDGDLFFVDSTHTLGPAGEVSRIVLEILPRLRVGVRVHFHDIYFPYDYPGDLLSTAQFFPHESVLLHAFLAGNIRFRLLAALSMLHHARPGHLKELLPNYVPQGQEDGLRTGPGHFPSSAYLLVTN